MVEDKNYVDMCVVCKEAVPKSDLVYQKGRAFHSQCFEKHGSSFPTPNNELAALSAKTRIELVQMKNLKARAEQGIIELNPSKKTKKSTKKTRTKKSKTKRRTKKSKKVKAKKRTVKKIGKRGKSKAKRAKAKRARPKRKLKSKAKRAKKRR